MIDRLRPAVLEYFYNVLAMKQHMGLTQKRIRFKVKYLVIFLNILFKDLRLKFCYISIYHSGEELEAKS